jgi:hypothetical protein
VVALGVLAVVGAGPTGPWADIVLVFGGFVGQFLAGFAASRIAGTSPALHGVAGSVAALAVLAVITLAAGSRPGMPGLAFGFVVAAVIGAAGGVLAAAGE